VARVIALILTAGAALWMAALIAAPLAAAHADTSAAAFLIYRAAALVCHQNPDRSFHLLDVPMPVCARCAGLYASGMVAACLAWFGPPSVSRRTPVLLALAAAPTVITVAIEWTGLAHPGNGGRAVASLTLGAAAGWVFVRMLRAEARPATCDIIR
jgi:uncharacterized membrane protein